MSALSNASFERLVDRIKRQEGYRRHPYPDRRGLSIGYGRHLNLNGITEEEAEYLLENDLFRAFDALERPFEWYRRLDDVRKAALAEMVFQMGIGSEKTRKGLLGFRNLIRAMAEGNYERAADEALDSAWARDPLPGVRRRAREIAEMLRTGEWNDGN